MHHALNTQNVVLYLEDVEVSSLMDAGYDLGQGTEYTLTPLQNAMTMDKTKQLTTQCFRHSRY